MTDPAAAGPSGWGWVGLSVSVYLLQFRARSRYDRTARPEHPSAERLLEDRFARGDR